MRFLRGLGQVLGIGLTLLLALGLAFGVGFVRSMQVCMPDTPPSARAFASRRPALADSGKPLVAVLLGDTQSDVTDVLAPYAMFSEAGTYEVRVVASSRAPRTLTGGLEVVPHLSFAELEAMRPNGPDIVVVPAILSIESEENGAVRTWLAHEHARRRLIFSWCTGGEVLAASHVVDGRSATAHWADIGRIESSYPEVTWIRGVRYVDEGDVLSAGGLTFGIDATLHLLRRRDGDAVARRVASAIHYPTPRAFETRRVAPNDFALADAIYLLNGAFYWPKRRTGVLLYDGVGELDLAAILDVHAASFTDVTLTIGAQPSVLSAHGLELVPRTQNVARADIERLLVPGGADEPAIDTAAHLVRMQQEPPVYPFRAAVEDLARRDGIATARFAARRLELRTPWQRPAVSPFPLRLLWVPTLALGLGVGLILIFQRFRRRKRAAKPV